MRKNRHRLILKPKVWGGLTLTLFLGGCGLPLSGTTISDIVDALATNNASACFQVSAGGGAGALAITPIPTIPAGGGGYASLIACRSNEPGSVILVKENGEMEIRHGVFKIPVDEKELKEEM